MSDRYSQNSRNALQVSGGFLFLYGLSYVFLPESMLQKFTEASTTKASVYLLRLCGITSLALGWQTGLMTKKSDSYTILSRSHQSLFGFSLGVLALIWSSSVLQPLWKTVFIGTNIVRILLHGYFGFL
eukprot:TRINITY_DN4171_c0_g1_i2.p1 TRINITY_DN4171_c0_g1~~TRINITY_DN4171_c0_g1_i2.p1  ORF type:complete len:128 (+),score=11.89 TRINITY_DN4171_c0_g1_i2:151-534(+)